VTQKKTGRPVQFEITEQTCNALAEWPAAVGSRRGAYLFPSRFRERPHLSTRQYARIVHRWVDRAGLDSSAYGTHSTRRTRRGPARAKPIAANPPNPIAVWRGSWRHDRPAVRLVRPRSGKSGLNLFSRAQYHGEICRSGWLSMSSAAHPCIRARRLFPVRSSECGSAIEAPITIRRGDLAASCGSSPRRGPAALLLLAAALLPSMAVAQRTTQPVFTELFACDPAVPSQLLGKWRISSQLDSSRSRCASASSRTASARRSAASRCRMAMGSRALARRCCRLSATSATARARARPSGEDGEETSQVRT
jgi:hypothetical protein